MSYLIKTDRGWLAFSGDVMLAGGRMHNWFDTEWDYGFAAGLYALIASASLLESFEPGDVAAFARAGDPAAEGGASCVSEKTPPACAAVRRGYKIYTFDIADQDTVSRPSVVPHVWQTTKHLFKFKEPRSGRTSPCCWPIAAGR